VAILRIFSCVLPGRSVYFIPVLFFQQTSKPIPLSYSIVEAVKRPCAFVIGIEVPIRTVKAILEFLEARNVLVDSFHMQMIGGGDALLILHGRIERDRARHIQRSLEKIDGVLSLELLEGKG
jgi:hypothetical protein